MILFLDFDGVLHPEGCEVDQLFCRAPLLWSLLREFPELRVVFSTSWREFHSLAELVDFCTAGGGEDLADRCIGTTPVVEPEAEQGEYRRREIECLAWIDQTGHYGPWMAVDDVRAWFAFGAQCVFITDYRTGLAEADVDKIRARLRELAP